MNTLVSTSPAQIWFEEPPTPSRPVRDCPWFTMRHDGTKVLAAGHGGEVKLTEQDTAELIAWLQRPPAGGKA